MSIRIHEMLKNSAEQSVHSCTGPRARARTRTQAASLSTSSRIYRAFIG